MVELGENYFYETGCWLPKKKLIVESDGGVCETFISISRMIKKELEMAFIFIDKNNNIVFFTTADNGCSERGNFDS
jgi:hypothetical protein